MHSEPNRLQLTFYYINGQTESFHVYDPTAALTIEQEIQQEMHRILEKHWWVLHLPEQTVYVNTANVFKVEIKPSMHRLQGDGVFPNAERITALSRAHE
jgi:hypothetical protein